MPSHVSLWGIQYPGRGDRFGEPFCRDAQEAGSAIARDLLERDLHGAVLLGHSLGAIIAYEAAVQLTKLQRDPSLLVVSSCAPPGLMRHRSLHAAADDEFWTGLDRLGGIDAEIIRNAELREVLSPILRSDLALHTHYAPSPGGPYLRCPIVCYQASSDPIVDDDGIEQWASYTTGPFELRNVEGEHFHAFEEGSQLVTEITGELLAAPDDRRQ